MGKDFPEWATRWISGIDLDGNRHEPDTETIEWIRSRPPIIQAIMRRFPPSCLVVGLIPLKAPAPGCIGIVSSYNENGCVTVRNGPAGDFRAVCELPWIRVVGYHGPFTPEWVEKILGPNYVH